MGWLVVTAEWVDGPPVGLTLSETLRGEGHGEPWKRGR